ncbi:MAG: TraR/DksA C4-type zinc finger protein [Pseudomonadota bacterium]
MITENEIAKYAAKLREALSNLEAESDARSQDRAVVELDQQMVGRLSRMDALQQQATAKGTQQRRQLEVRRIKAALDRIEEGEFGYCTDCGDALPGARLAMDPAAPRCVSCATG